MCTSPISGRSAVRTTEALAALLWIAAGCGGGPIEPRELVLNEEACSLCRMAVSQRPFAAQAVSRSGSVDFFDDIGCLAQWTPMHVHEETARFVVDYETGAWLDATKAYFVRAPRLDTPMSSGLAAFGTRDRAVAAAAKLRGEVLDWDEVHQ